MARKQAFKNSDAAYAKAFNAGKTAQVAALYSRDALFLMPDAPAFKGRKGVQTQVQASLDGGWRNIKFKTIRSGSGGDLAFNIGQVSYEQASASGTTKVKGKYLDVYRRQADGSWKIIATAANMDAPAK